MHPSPRSARGYRPRHASAQQDAILDEMVQRSADGAPHGVAVFDLDACLFDNRPRIIQIWRELASRAHLPALYRVEEQHFLDWDHRRTLTNAGLTPDEIDAALPQMERAFFRDFFADEYVIHDHPMPGAARQVWRCYEAGVAIAYLTGRHEEMRRGTQDALVRMGFPFQRPGTHLVMKPTVEADDLPFKREALREIKRVGPPVVLVDNEPGNVNIFLESCPDALVVWVETDHSPRPIHPAPSIPGIRGWLRTTDAGAEIGEGVGPAGSVR